MGKRHKARELALKCLYAFDSVGESVDQVCKSVVATSDLNAEARDFAEAVFRKVAATLAELDGLIERHSQNWDIQRLAMVDRNILRLAICELLYFPDIPARVVINEAVELAKRYSTGESSRFVNGLLDAVYHETSAGEK